MNFWDRQIGALDGAAATARNYEAVIDQWEDHPFEEAWLRLRHQDRNGANDIKTEGGGRSSPSFFRVSVICG